jgi:Cytochrome c7 and related cytochrome c
MKFRVLKQSLVLIALVLFAGPSGAANIIEKMMMPGELSTEHSKLEEDCSNCHKSLQKEAQSELCADCHKPVKDDIALQRGFHGKDLLVKKSECFTCHVEHRGRETKLIRLEKIMFNHDTTEFPLKGRHATAMCSGCHVAGKKFREAQHLCFDCHKTDEPHRGQLGTDCAQCHSVEGWRTNVATFDHSKTRFPLKGKHQQQPCISCHVGEVYKNLPMTCNDCHAIQDVHATRFGTSCNECHSSETWKGAKFDHTKKTRFALTGAHAKAICSDCHGANVSKKISMACFDCHAAQDVHKAQLGAVCSNCHTTTSWRKDVKFDHDLTSYPLIGLHAAAPCESCHATKAYKGVVTTCINCHAKDDTHLGRFTTRCESCHSPSGWQRVAFEHGRDTKFALTGAHARVGCYDCHTAKNVADASLPTSCISCHQRQDVHRGAFGTDCARCHTTSTFKTAIIRK